MPTACAAMPMRPPSSVRSAIDMPLPGSPRRSAGVSSNVRSAVEDEFRPIFSSSRVTAKPSAPRAHEERARARPSSSRAKTWWTRKEPFVIHCLAPVIRPSVARVRIAPASEPASAR